MKIDQELYKKYKKEVRGFYMKFNSQVLKYYIHKLFDYDYLLKSVTRFDNFEKFYYFHIKGKTDKLKEYIIQMLRECERKNIRATEELVIKCFIVRMGNIYNGIYTEHKILTTFSNLAPYIICTKTTDEVDMDYKVDAVIELSGIDKMAIQIKPISFLKYGADSELRFHKKFEKEYETKVYYVFYDNENFESITFNRHKFNLDDTDKISEYIENILIYSS